MMAEYGFQGAISDERGRSGSWWIPSAIQSSHTYPHLSFTLLDVLELDWTDRLGWTDMTGQAGHAAPCVARLRWVLVPKAPQHLPGSLEHPHFCLEALMYGKCVKLGLILPKGTLGSSPLLLSQAVSLTLLRSGVPGDGGKNREAIWLKTTLPQKKELSPMGIRSLMQPTTRRRAVPGNCVDFPSEKQLAGSDLSSSGSQRCQHH